MKHFADIDEAELRPPKSADELLARYAAGERCFFWRQPVSEGVDVRGAILSGANLSGATFHGGNFEGARLRRAVLNGCGFFFARFRGADMREADLRMTDLGEASLTQCNLRGAHLGVASAWRASFRGADLADAKLWGVSFKDADLGGANCERAELRYTVFDGTRVESSTKFDGCILDGTTFVDTDLSPLCGAPGVVHRAPSAVDWRSVLRSHRHPDLLDFLISCGMPWQWASYSIDIARSLDPTLIFSMLQSTFISYGGPDAAFARRLSNELKQAGVTTFFFEDDAPFGRRLHRVMHQGVNSFDRVILLCSRDSLDRPGVLNELERTLVREARNGGAEYLLPITLDDYVFHGWRPPVPDLREQVVERVVADFRGTSDDDAKFRRQFQRLLASLRRLS